MIDRSRYGDLVALLLAVGGVAAVAVAGLVAGSEIVPLLTRDMAASFAAHPFTGILSNLGAFAWLVSATVLALTLVVLQPMLPRARSAFLLSATILSMLLLIDDFFMMHDFVLRRYLGVPEVVTLGVGAMLALGHIAIFRSEYLGFRPMLFGCSLLLLVASVGIDLVEPQLGEGMDNWRYLLEDSSKWMGIIAWTWWHVTFCVNQLDCYLAGGRPNVN